MDMQTPLTQIKNSLKDIQWRWIFAAAFAVFGTLQISMFLIISIYVARSSAAGNALSYEEILQFSDALGAWVGPFVFFVFTFVVSMWQAIRVRIAPRMHGFVLGLIIFISFSTLEIVLSPSLELGEIINNLIAIPIAWLGAYRGEITLKNREAVYRTSQAIRGADRSGVVKAIGEQLTGSSVVLIALVDETGKVDAASTWTSSSNQTIPTSIPSLQTPPKVATVLKGSDLPLANSNIHALLVLPLSQVGEALVIGSRNRNGFSRNDTQNYLTIAEQVALSLENLKLLEQARQSGVNDERQRLAAEIHDSLSQGFISIVTHLEIAEAKLESFPQGLRDDLQPLLNKARQTARDNLTVARQMTWALRPDLQEGAPLTDALAKLGKRWSDKNNIPVDVSSSGDARQLHPDIETALLRTAREALNNIQKHAQATRVTVTLTYLDSLVALDIQDNGKGFAAEASRDSAGGFGLKSIREQVERLGGELTLESMLGKGSTVAVSIPHKLE